MPQPRPVKDFQAYDNDNFDQQRAGSLFSWAQWQRPHVRSCHLPVWACSRNPADHLKRNNRALQHFDPARTNGRIVEALRSAANELHSSPAEPVSEIHCASIDQLTAQLGAWGEHPSYRRSDWQYLVANGDTQRGYWEHVLESLKEAREDYRPAGTDNA